MGTSESALRSALPAEEALAEARSYVAAAIDTFSGDPPDSDYQRGYLSALEDVAKEAFPPETLQ